MAGRTDTSGGCIYLSLAGSFEAYDRVAKEQDAAERMRSTRMSALQNCLRATRKQECNGFRRMLRCRQALEAIDRRGWLRSFHQRMFHDNFIRACARIFWKREPHGAFAKDHQRILEVNGWDHLSQEVLVSTPRRFGKTISVSMFAAAMLYSCPNLEMSIYSTCKRISQKLLRNVQKFLDLIYLELRTPRMKELRINMEEIVLQGDECDQDVRSVNSYPSKVEPQRPPRSRPPAPARAASARDARYPCGTAPRRARTFRSGPQSWPRRSPAGRPVPPAESAGLVGAAR